jgi:hypothetical protein
MKQYKEYNYKKLWICYKIKLCKKFYFSMFIQNDIDFVIFKIDFLNMNNSEFYPYYFFEFDIFNFTIFKFFKSEKYKIITIFNFKIME